MESAFASGSSANNSFKDKVQLQDYTLEVNYQIEELAFEDVYHGNLIVLPKKVKKKEKKPAMKRPCHIEVFDNKTAARRKFCYLENLDNEYLARPYFLVESTKEASVVGEPVYDGLQKWIEKDDVRIWDYKFDAFGKEKACIGLGEDFQKVSRGILRGLEHLHEQQKCHGNLLEGITISDDHKVKLVRFGDPDHGILNDLNDFVQFVKDVVNCHPVKNSLPQPPALDLFFKLHSTMSTLTDGGLFKDRCFFVYHNAVFWNGHQRYNFIQKMNDIRRFLYKPFKKRFTLNGTLTSMENWHTAIAENSKLWDVLHYKNNYKRYKDNPAAILNFSRNAYEHLSEGNESSEGIETSEGNETGFVDLDDIEKMLYEIFPDACPKMFYWFALEFQPLKEVKQAFSERTLGGTLMEFLKNEPHAFHLPK